MTASEGTFLGFARQTGVGVPNVTDLDFEYILFGEGGIGPEPMIVPLDPEVGGGAMLRDVVKVGVVSRGQFSFVPRPSSLGRILYGALGTVTTTDDPLSLTYSHAFKLGTNQFAAPYNTVRVAPGNMWGESFQDCRFNSLALAWRGANFVRAQAGVVGGLPTQVATTTWGALARVDGGPQFLAPVSHIEVPTATALKVLSGSFTAGMNIPLDEQWITGSYSPDAFDITQRAFQLSLVVKITDDVLYKKAMYDPTGGAAWAASMFREANINIQFNSAVMADLAVPYSLKIAANGSSGAGANVVWSAQPVNIKAGKQITMALKGTFLADPAGSEPLVVTLVNKVATY